MGIRRGGGVVEGLGPESLEEFVRATPKEDCVETRDGRRTPFADSLVRHDPFQVPVWSCKATVRRHPANPPLGLAGSAGGPENRGIGFFRIRRRRRGTLRLSPDCA